MEEANTLGRALERAYLVPTYEFPEPRSAATTGCEKEQYPAYVPDMLLPRLCSKGRCGAQVQAISSYGGTKVDALVPRSEGITKGGEYRYL